MDLLSPLHPTLLAQHKAAPYSGVQSRDGVGGRGGGGLRFTVDMWASEPTAVQRGSGFWYPALCHQHTGACTGLRPLTTICIYSTLLRNLLKVPGFSD